MTDSPDGQIRNSLPRVCGQQGSQNACA